MPVNTLSIRAEQEAQCMPRTLPVIALISCAIDETSLSAKAITVGR
jgi:hypothetical protein